MVNKPPLPEGFDLPEEVNGWIHTPKSNKNGHIWIGESAQRSVGVFSGITDRVRVAVFDDRVDGFCSKIQPVERSFEDGETQAEATAWGVKRAVAWMEHHAPDRWDHPHVEEAVFDPPVGFVLDRYYLEERKQIVCYRQKDSEKAVSMAGGRPRRQSQAWRRGRICSSKRGGEAGTRRSHSRRGCERTTVRNTKSWTRQKNAGSLSL